ncbi:hypothetical protein [Actinoplanes aureus]|jgi:protocatechuate 3,4-dioxygenase beta subunit|uniref:Intradiol ring-cleavage dioxygenases domain-containing protein n=1 Tax=Actinoplanes aureus TaxID=2792083 RepID=A0A931FVB2_9ACTN|nr:hypothetical protein [Actinoplanes aureus]MBG0560070.1 hypothetical protein [Actinoplanes aureus]
MTATLSLDRPAERAHGVPLTVRLRLLSTGSGRPMPGYAVSLWHCEQPEVAWQTADPTGWVSFPSSFPDAGAGRWPHVHFEVFSAAGDRLHTAQLALPGDACATAFGRRHVSGHTLATDSCFTGGWALEIASVTGDAARGLVATRTVGV